MPPCGRVVRNRGSEWVQVARGVKLGCGLGSDASWYSLVDFIAVVA